MVVCINSTHEDMYLVTSIPMKNKIFSVVTKCLQYFLHSLFPLVFGVTFFPSCSCFPSQSFQIHGFVHEPFEHLCCLTYSLLSSYIHQESNFLKKTLFTVFGVVEDIATFSSWWFCLLVPRFGTRHWKDSMAHIGAILWNNLSFID